MNYDQTDIAATYDRGREHGPAVRMLWMRTVARHLHAAAHERIVDLGCGTARFTDALAVHFDAHVTGIDPSMTMLEQARRKRHDGHVSFVLGAAEALPFASAAVDAIFMSMSFHHFSDTTRAARECRRVLHEGGTVIVRNGSREQIAAYPYYPFFPASHPILHEVLPAVDAIRAPFESAGFKTAAVEIVEQTIAQSWHEYADKLEANADSVLVRLPRDDFVAGIAAVRRHADTARDQRVIEPIDVLVFR
jgi:ubiquinone/menaquinone biosynthesis C-methylase UbiE